MKNKKTTWILLLGVLGIWGILGWKFYAGLHHSEPEVNTVNADESVENIDTLVPNNYSLLLDYADPFLGNSDRVIKNNSGRTPAKINSTPNLNHQPAPESQQTIAWPEVHYSGLVKSPTTGKMVGFITVNGQTEFVSEGDAVDVLVVKKLWKDSVAITMGKEMRMVRK